MKKRILSILMCFILVISAVPFPAAAEYGDRINYGRSYDHIDVKVDGQYTVSVDGEKVVLNGRLQQDKIAVRIGNKTYDYEQYRVRTNREDGRYEYEIRVNFSPDDIAWVSGTYKMTNVYVSGRMLFETVPDSLKDVLNKTNYSGRTYYYIDFEDYRYDGVQECTYGNGLRSEGNTGTPSGLDLYIKASGMSLIITKGKLAIEKEIVDEAGAKVSAAEDPTAFEYKITDANGNTVYFANGKYDASGAAGGAASKVSVKNGETLTLEGLPAGKYTITEIQKTGYSIREISGNPTGNYSTDYVVKTKTDSDIPVAVFTNTKLTNAAVSIKKLSTGLPGGAEYPNPTVSIYAADEAGRKTGTALWSGTVPANGDVIYPNTYYFAPGTYIVEETGADVSEYRSEPVLKVDGSAAADMRFTVEEGTTNIELVIENRYEEIPETLNLPVEKVWQNVPDGTELPEKVTVSLYADGSENPVGTIDLDAEGQWRGVFEGVPKYSGSGDEISYTVGETPVENYTSAYSETAVGGWIITNTYNVPTPPPDPSPAVVNIRASKTLDGAAPSGEVFSFILKNGDGSTVQTKNNAGGTVVFSPLTFSAEGIYTYTLEEALGTDGSINYDGTVYTITVNVIKDSAGNRYTAEVSYVKDGAPYDGEPVFENTTKTGTVIVGKTVSGGGSSTSQRFTFKATLNSAAEADGAESVFSGKYGDVEFVGGTAEFSLKHGESVTISGLPAGTVYYIEETDSDGYTVSVNGRSGSAAEGVASAGESETLNFNNYKAGGSTHIPSQAVVEITAEKTLDGTAPSGSGFTFTLKDESGRTVQTKNNDGGNITFDALTFSKTGIYKYTIEETAGDDSAVNYDSTVYTAVINVTRSGDYRAEVSYEKNGEPVSGTPVFENTTKQTPADPDEGTVSVSVSKVWNDGNGKNRPDSVKVQLYKDGNAYGDIVVLSAPGGWTYTWQDLEKDAVWSVDEAEVPDGYKKSVAHRDNIWIITNTARALDDVPQTGDTGSAGIWLVIAAASALGLAGTVVLKKRGFEKRK